MGLAAAEAGGHYWAKLITLMNWLKKYWGGILLGLFAIGSFCTYQDHQRMHQRAHYTIGYITGWHPTPKSGIHYEYRFTVRDSTYEDASQSDVGMNTEKGARCVVKYDSIDPAVSVGYFNVPIPDSIRQPPANGWRKPPFPIPEWILNMGQQQK